MENKVGGYDKSPINLLLFYLCLRVWGPQPRKQMPLRLHSTRGACGGATGRPLTSDGVSTGRGMAEGVLTLLLGPVQPPWTSASSSVKWGRRAPQPDS